MRWAWPSLDKVRESDPRKETAVFVRWATLLPEPETPVQAQIATLVREKLNEADPAHRQVIENALGYGPSPG